MTLSPLIGENVDEEKIEGMTSVMFSPRPQISEARPWHRMSRVRVTTSRWATDARSSQRITAQSRKTPTAGATTSTQITSASHSGSPCRTHSVYIR